MNPPLAHRNSRQRGGILEYRRWNRRKCYASFASDTNSLDEISDLCILCGGDRDIQPAQVFLQILDRLSSRDGEEIIALCQYPRQHQLAGGVAFCLRGIFEFLDQLDVLGEVLWAVSRVASAHIGGFEVVERLKSSG